MWASGLILSRASPEAEGKVIFIPDNIRLLNICLDSGLVASELPPASGNGFCRGAGEDML